MTNWQLVEIKAAIKEKFGEYESLELISAIDKLIQTAQDTCSNYNQIDWGANESIFEKQHTKFKVSIKELSKLI